MMANSVSLRPERAYSNCAAGSEAMARSDPACANRGPRRTRQIDLADVFVVGYGFFCASLCLSAGIIGKRSCALAAIAVKTNTVKTNMVAKRFIVKSISLT
jgi:hypothetical protein